MKKLAGIIFLIFIFTSGYSFSQTCSDGIQNGSETGIDCGGTCPPCGTPCQIELTYTLGGVPPTPVTYTMSSGTISTCNGVFTDPGGPTGSYSNNQTNTQTFCSDSPGDQITFTFTQWAVESGWDYLTIYDGPNTSGTELFYGSGASPGTITSTTGCLTFYWDTDGSVVYAGWSADISCGPIVPPTLDCTGGDIVLTAVGQGASVLALDNDFDFGNAGSGWTSNVNASFTNPCDASIDGGTYMWMGNSAQHPRIIQTTPLDLSCGGEICFWLDFATQGQASPCEGIDLPDEGVYLEFSTDGGTSWTTIEYFGPAGVGNSTNSGGTNPQMTAWNQYCYTIPTAAETPNTIIHWAQTGSSGLNNDHWGIDNVSISSVADCTPYWYDYSQIPGAPDNPVQSENVTATTTYTVTYTNGNDGCTTSITVPVGPCPCPDAVVSGGGTYCAGDSIPDVIFDVTGGNFPLTLTYAIDGVNQPSVTFSSTSYTLYNPTQGAYTIVAVTDPSMCVGTFSGSASIGINPPPVLDDFGTGGTYCTGDVVGDIVVQASGAASFTLNYSIDGVAQTPMTGPSPLNLGNAEGVYTLTSLAIGGCSIPLTETETILINPVPTASVVGGGTYCMGDSIPDIVFSVVSGAYPVTLTYAIDGVSQTPLVFSASSYTLYNATDGQYSIVSIADQGCSGTFSGVADITSNPLPTLDNIYGGATYCAGDIVDDIIVEATGANPLSISYTLDGVAQTPVTGNSPLNLGNTPGVYQLTSLADDNCASIVNGTETIIVNPIPVATAGTSTPVICEGSDISLTSNTSSGTYSWTGPNGFSSISEDPTISGATVNDAGTYTLVVTENGCSSPPSTVDVVVNPSPVVTTNANQTICVGTAVTLSGQGATTYSWDNGITNGVSFVPGTGTITYTVTGTSNGCTSTASVTVIVLDQPVADASPNVNGGYQPLNVTFQNLSSNATSYVWDFGDGNVVPTNSGSAQTNTYLLVSTYYVTLVASNGICNDTWTDSIVVIAFPAIEIDVPNVFTPNGDDANEEYFIHVVNGASMEATILNRWGNEIYFIDELNKGWDGKIGGQDASEGVYFIKYLITGLDGSVNEGHTFFHLIR